MTERSRWLIPTVDPIAAQALATALGVQLVTAGVLLSRGLSDVDRARRFLTPDLGHLHDPLLLTGMREAVARIKTAIQAKEKILIYGDYDVDGIV
jgi:single-stranded-DNA-specific exonuclease